MRRAKPVKPKGLPEGTIQIGGPIEWFDINLRVRGDDLVLDEITSIMGCEPDEAWEKGKPIYREDGSVKRIPRFGHWALVLKPEDTDEWECGPAMLELLSRLPSDVNIWRTVTEKYKADFFVGLYMPDNIRGFILEPDVMQYLGERNIEAGFDIYGPEDIYLPEVNKNKRV